MQYGLQQPQTARTRSPSHSGIRAERFTPSPTSNQVQDSTGITFEFKDKINDSSASISSQEGFYGKQNDAQNNPQTITSNYIEVSMRDPNRTPAHFDSPGEIRGSKPENTTTKQRSSASREQIEFGDVSDKQAYLIQQNTALKELVHKLQTQTNHLQADKTRLERELNNIMDPLSKSTQLKEVIPD